jgi:hypothetical protein
MHFRLDFLMVSHLGFRLLNRKRRLQDELELAGGPSVAQLLGTFPGLDRRA